MRWAEIRVETDETSEDAVVNILIEQGCAGTVCISINGTLSVSGYLPVDDLIESRLEAVRERIRLLPEMGISLPSTQLQINWVEDKDWEESYKAFFKPVRVGKIVVSPSWENPSLEEGDIVVWIDPGMAFGTGYHETTRLCLTALQNIIRGGEVVLDVGTGTGILAIASARLGAGYVVGIDIDPVAVRIACENVSRNDLTCKVAVLAGDSPGVFSGMADVVVANIVPDVIISMSADLAAKLKPDGVLISSGIVRERMEDVRRALESVEMDVDEVLEENGWVALVSRLQNAGGLA
ncbi:MAG: 50S ribosomal protein L11 methyltransferase [Armatimonadota bacterium]